MFLGTPALDWISAFVRFLGSTGPKGQLTGGKLPIFQFWKPKKWFFMIFSSKNWLFSYSIAKIWLIKTYENKKSLKKAEKIKKCITKISEGSIPPICRIRPLCTFSLKSRGWWAGPTGPHPAQPPGWQTLGGSVTLFTRFGYLSAKYLTISMFP